MIAMLTIPAGRRQLMLNALSSTMGRKSFTLLGKCEVRVKHEVCATKKQYGQYLQGA